jgi:hypothetical protein
MAKAPKIYTRLTRSPVSLGNYKSLWIAADHLMQVDSNGYSENYQRFHFADIQGFFIGPSGRRLYWSLFWGVIALFSGIPFIAGLLRGEPLGVSVIFFAIASAFLIWNALLGPSCHVYLVTRVQTVRLGALVRRRKAVKVLGRLQPLIENAQHSLVTPVAVEKTTTASPPQEPAAPPSLL